MLQLVLWGGIVPQTFDLIGCTDREKPKMGDNDDQKHLSLPGITSAL